MKQPLTTVPHKKQKKKMSKKLKRILGFSIGGGIAFLACLGLFCHFLTLFLYGSKPTITEDPKAYSLIFENYVHSGLMVFPEEISPTADNVEFYYSWRDTFGSPTAEIYLSCTYSPEEYTQEAERISNIQKQIGTVLQKICFDDCENFNYPAYVAVSDNYEWEYALCLEDSHTIKYIFTQFKQSETVHFDTDYLPDIFDDGHRLEFGEGFSLYEIPTYIGSDLALDTYYDRNPVTAQAEGHYVESGKHTFTVCTDIDKNGTETITGCILYYNENLTSAHFWEAKEEQTEYTELNGMIYKNISLNDDRSRVIITCEKENEETAFVFDIASKEFLK